MAENRYDAIVVGARCAGSPTAMLLARKGYKVLVVDRARFPSDTVSTHIVHPPGVSALRRWGLLDRLVATGCPPIDTYALDFGPFTISGAPGTEEAPVAYAPRRTVLDKLLVDAASEAGVEVREGFTVEEVVLEDGRVTGVRGRGRDGGTVTEHAPVVVGADGRHSLVARAVKPEQYHEKPQLLCGYYTYWSGLLPMYELTTQLATLEPPPPEWQQLLAAMVGNRDAMDGFARVMAGVTSPAEFFSEENAGRILAAAR